MMCIMVLFHIWLQSFFLDQNIPMGSYIYSFGIINIDLCSGLRPPIGDINALNGIKSGAHIQVQVEFS